MAQAFAHPPLNEPVTAIGGSYQLVAEARLPLGDQEVLYLVGHALFDTSCCGAGGCAFALVPGRVVVWRGETGPDGLPVSQLEPIRDPSEQAEIARLIRARERVHQVMFL